MAILAHASRCKSRKTPGSTPRCLIISMAGKNRDLSEPVLACATCLISSSLWLEGNLHMEGRMPIWLGGKSFLTVNIPLTPPNRIWNDPWVECLDPASTSLICLAMPTPEKVVSFTALQCLQRLIAHSGTYPLHHNRPKMDIRCSLPREWQQSVGYLAEPVAWSV